MLPILMLLVSLINTSSSFYLNYTQWDCYNSSIPPLTNSYETNLNHLLSTLVSQISTANYKFLTLKQGSENQDPAYGLAVCRGDVNTEDCDDCVKMAREEVTSSCPRARQAIIWKEKCMIHYSNQSFFSLLQQQPIKVLYNIYSVTDQVFDWTKLLHDVLQNITSTAASVKTGNKFATMEAWFSPMNTYLYTLAQCNPDFTTEDCTKCFSVAFDNFQSLLKQGGIVLTPSCSLRYEIYEFYKILSLGQSPIPSIAPPPTDIARINREKKKASSTKVVVAITVTSAVLGVLIALGICLYRKKAKKHASIDVKNVLNDLTTAESLMFDLGTLEVATDNFSDEQKLGQGGFGSVYKGTLANGKEIAVKRLSKISGQGVDEFKNEVVLVANLQHRNLVKLLGFCLAGEERLLVYEYVPNKSLNYFLFDARKRGELTWSTRYDIIRGIARGLVYLHEDSRPRIIHRDLKSGNILLDANMNPKIADFGLARIFKVEQMVEDTTRVVGTYGYMAPEYAMHGQFSVKSDAYSFGVMVLEIVSGKKISSASRSGDLLTNAWRSLTEERPLEFMDPTLNNSYSSAEVLRCIHIGLWCAQENTNERPTMSKVVLMLNADSTTYTMPKIQCPRSFYQSSNESSLVSRLSLHSMTTTSNLDESLAMYIKPKHNQ